MQENMREKLIALQEKYEKLTESIADPELMADQSAWQKQVKAHSDLKDIVNAYNKYEKADKELIEAKSILDEEDDAEMQEMAELEIAELKAQLATLEKELEILLIPKDPNDEKNVILEVRAGTGGDEAGLFANDLLKMYTHYAEDHGWKVEIMEASYTNIGGIKEAILLIEGKGAYSKLKFESGVHRVQRVPETESSGRIHTSAATVAVLPEAEEVDLKIDPGDIRVDVFCSSGPGGQSVNTTQSAVRITHIPTDTVVSCQDEKSQHKNKDKAMKILRSRILEKLQAEKMGSEAQARKSLVGSGDRSERIRTYNFPQGRVTDHRIGLTVHKLEWVLGGDLDKIISALITTDQAEKLRQEA